MLAFFALSGFVIAEAADIAYRGRPVAFLGNRLLRIVPHFVLAMAMSIVLQGYFVAAGTLHVERYAPPPPGSAFSLRNIALNFASILPRRTG